MEKFMLSSSQQLVKIKKKGEIIMAFTSVVTYVCAPKAVSAMWENGNLKYAQFKISRSTGRE